MREAGLLAALSAADESVAERAAAGALKIAGSDLSIGEGADSDAAGELCLADAC